MSEDAVLVGGKHTEIRQIDATPVEKLAKALGRRAGAAKGRSRSPSARGAAEHVDDLVAKAAEALLPSEISKAPNTALFLVLSDDEATVRTIGDVMKYLPGLIKARRRRRIEDEVAKLVDIVMPRDAADDLARDIGLENAALRQEFIRAWPSLRSGEVHTLSGRTSRNAALTASRWKGQKKLFAVPFGGHDRYPAFQFKDGRPQPVVGRVLARLGGRLSPWQTAFWFVAENGWLAGRRPVDLLDADPDAVVEAAGHEVTETLT